MFDIFYITSRDGEFFKKFKSKYPAAKRASSLLEAKRKCFTKFFWAVFDDLEVYEDFDFSYEPDDWSQDVVHVFRNGNYYDGVCLIPKNNLPTEKEFEYRFFTQKKEVDIQASIPRPYDSFYIDTYEEYLNALEKTTTEFFWVIPSDVEINSDFDFSYQAAVWEKCPHLFLNDKFYDGISLHNTNSPITKKEFEYRFFTQKKEVDIQASYPLSYDRFYIDTYEEYLNALEKTTTEFFWVIPTDVEINSDFDFSYQAAMYEKYPHVFLNGKFYDGISLHNTNSPITKKEFEYRFFTQKKEVDIQASSPKAFDIVFISYNEPNAEQNFENLKSRFPRAIRIHGVKGIHNAHIEAAKKVKTEMFWVVDADAEIVNGFDFDYQVPRWQRDTVHVWRSKNPVNELVYGYGGVKLLPTQMTIDMNKSKPDMTTSISSKFKAVEEISNITSFNTDSFNSWKSAFRECAKLASRIIDRQNNYETEERLDIWCNKGTNKPFGVDTIKGAKAGRIFGEENKDNSKELAKINDFNWLYERFSKNSV